jgi:hypothetical protein
MVSQQPSAFARQWPLKASVRAQPGAKTKYWTFEYPCPLQDVAGALCMHTLAPWGIVKTAAPHGFSRKVTFHVAT